MFRDLCLKYWFLIQAMFSRKVISLDREIKFGKCRLCLNFQSTYLKVSITMPIVPEGSSVVSLWQNQYKFLNSGALISGAGFSLRVHWKRRLFVTRQFRKKSRKLSLVRVSLFMIRQKEHRGETVLSKAFSRLLSGRELFLKRKRKFLKSLQMKDLFQFPMQTLRIDELGTGRSIRFEYCITVHRFSGLAESLLL